MIPSFESEQTAALAATDPIDKLYSENGLEFLENEVRTFSLYMNGNGLPF